MDRFDMETAVRKPYQKNCSTLKKMKLKMVVQRTNVGQKLCYHSSAVFKNSIFQNVVYTLTLIVTVDIL